MTTYSIAECRERAEGERQLAEGATLANVRERHLRAARTWDELAARGRLVAEAAEKKS